MFYKFWPVNKGVPNFTAPFAFTFLSAKSNSWLRTLDGNNEGEKLQSLLLLLCLFFLKLRGLSWSFLLTIHFRKRKLAQFLFQKPASSSTSQEKHSLFCFWRFRSSNAEKMVEETSLSNRQKNFSLLFFSLSDSETFWFCLNGIFVIHSTSTKSTTSPNFIRVFFQLN